MEEFLKEVSILIGGEAGDGIRKCGEILGRILASLGFEVFVYNDYQSLIRKGHNFSIVRASKDKIFATREKVDLIFAFNQETIKKHKQRLDKKGILLFDKDKAGLEEGKGISLSEVLKTAEAPLITKNMAGVGGVAKVLGIDFETLEEVFTKSFGRYAKVNLKVARLAFDSFSKYFTLKSQEVKKEVEVLTGNEAIALGMAKAGLEFYFAYPMTPASGILHFLAGKEKELNLKTIQPENEIGVILMALGCAYGGKRTAVGTSGGGFALMTEGLSLASQSETPILIVEAQRTGPSTGVPTYTAQGDLKFILGAGHGDIVRLVVAPGDLEEAYFWAGEALNLTWKYQIPAILLSDKHLSESLGSLDSKIKENLKKKEAIIFEGEENYLRYKITENGISPLAFPGEKGLVVKASSYEHKEDGITTEEAEGIKRMQEKRVLKLRYLKKEVEEKYRAVNVFGKKKSKVALVTFGSQKMVAREVAESLGLKMVQPIVLEPFCTFQMEKALKGVKKIAVVEENSTGQFATLLNANGFKVDQRILKYDGRPFEVEELEREVKSNLP